MADAATAADTEETIKSVSKATGVQRTLHVEWDPKTGTFVVCVPGISPWYLSITCGL